jgi:hypothetical protein
MRRFPAHPFLPLDDGDKLKEECGIFGVVGVNDAANFVALGLHALQHRGQEAGGIVAHDAEQGFNSVRRFGYVRDNFTKAEVMQDLPGSLAIGHVRYSTTGGAGLRNVQPLVDILFGDDLKQRRDAITVVRSAFRRNKAVRGLERRLVLQRRQLQWLRRTLFKLWK